MEYGPYDVLSSQPTQQLFAFKVEEKTTCLQSQKVRYKAQTEFTLALEVPESIVPRPTVEQEAKKPKLEDVAKPRCPLDACLSHWAATESVVDYTSPATGLRGEASRHTRLQTCPRYLLVKINRYYATADWTEKKLDVLVEVPEKLDLSQLRAPSTRPAGEEELPDEEKPPAPKFVPDPGILAQLLSMGFDENGCKRACKATNNAGPEAASEWVFSHMDDADFSAPFVDDDAPSEKKVDEAAVNELVMFGFTPREAEAALVACSGNKEHAANWLFEQGENRDQAVADVLDGPSAAAAPAAPSDFDDGPPHYELKGLVSHIGSNTGCGHYVAHIREKDGRWVIFDDEKVAHSKSPPVQLAYLYLYARK